MYVPLERKKGRRNKVLSKESSNYHHDPEPILPYRIMSGKENISSTSRRGRLLVVQDPACDRTDVWDLVSAVHVCQYIFHRLTALGTNLSSVSASLYALRTSQAMRTRSPRKRTQLRKLDHQKSRCRTKTAVNRRLDCHAWNL